MYVPEHPAVQVTVSLRSTTPAAARTVTEETEEEEH